MVQVVSGLTWLSEARRLRPMIEEHTAVMAEADADGTTREGLRAAVRDDLGSEALTPLLPERVTQGVDDLERLSVVQTPESVKKAVAPTRRKKRKKAEAPVEAPAAVSAA